jgi:ankyrin repeat protein
LLLQKGARVNLQDQFGESALHVLMKRSPQNKVNLKKIREMVTLFKTYGGDLELRSDAGDTALLVAAKSGHLNWVKILISMGADINAQDRNQETILFRFAREKNKRAVKELIKLGVNKELKNIEGIKVTDIIKL